MTRDSSLFSQGIFAKSKIYFVLYAKIIFFCLSKTRIEMVLRMLKELKSPQKDSGAWCSLSDRLLMAEDSLAAIR
jgi:hypothetical protein